MENRVFIGGISFKATKQDLATLLSKYGNVSEIKLPYDVENDRIRGYAFVTFENGEQASEAIKALNGSIFLDRFIGVMKFVNKKG